MEEKQYQNKVCESDSDHVSHISTTCHEVINEIIPSDYTSCSWLSTSGILPNGEMGLIYVNSKV